MKHKDRFFATILYEPVDRPATWLGMPVPAAEQGLKKYFRAGSVHELKKKIDDDVYPVEVPYNYPPFNHISHAFDFSKTGHPDTPGNKTLNTTGFFEDYENPADIDKFNWPDPSQYLDREEAKRRAKAIDAGYARMGILWSAHFQDAFSAFGMEKALVTMLNNPGMFREVIDRITGLYLKANEIFFEATRGCLDAVLIGNDLGSQTGLIIQPELIREFVFPGTKLLIEQAKSYDLKVMHHSCGSVFPVINDLIELGADIIHPVQALATDMDVHHLRRHFYGRVAFCGGIDAQQLLVKGKPDNVADRVREVIEVFPTGLIISPDNEAITPDIPPENIEALFNSIRKYQ